MTPRKKMITWGRMIDRFLIEFEIDGATDATLDTYRWVLEHAAAFYEQRGYEDPAAINEDDLLDVLGHWRKLATTTRAGRISVLKTFYAWVAKRYGIEDPARNLRRPRKQSVARRRLSAAEVQRILEGAASERDRLVLWLMAMTGVRRGELIRLRWGDVDFPNESLRVVIGKGRKGREIAIGPDLYQLLADTKARLEEQGAYNADFYVCPRARIVAPPGATPLVAVWPDKPMGVTTPNKILARAAKMAEIPRPTFVSPHDLRRAYAGAFLAEHPGDIRTLQALLGHADIGTTQLYLPAADQASSLEKVKRVRFITQSGADTVPDVIPEGIEQ